MSNSPVLTNAEILHGIALDALREIADRYDHSAEAPRDEDWGGCMEDAYNNGCDYGTYLQATVAQRALVAIGDRQQVEIKQFRCEDCGELFDEELKTNQQGSATCPECSPELYTVEQEGD